MRSRPLVILITVLFLLSSVFVFSASASSDSYNLIEQDLTQWSSIDDSPVVYSKNDDIYRVTCKGSTYELSNGNTYSAFYGLLYDLPSFVAGHSYTLKFKLPSGADIASAWNNTYTDDNVINYYKNTTVVVGYGFLSSDGTTVNNPTYLFEFNADNISDYVGKTLTASFLCENAPEGGRPCVFIHFVIADANNHLFFFSDFVLIDNDDDSAELGGILGFLHSIKWDLVGGICDEEDCPHSNADNPHLSLFDKLSMEIEVYFKSITDEISGFFTGLGNLLLYFDWEGDYENPFEDNYDTVAQLSARLEQIIIYISDVGDSFEEIVDSITGTLDLFSRVVERYDWLLSLCVFTLAFLVISRFIGL